MLRPILIFLMDVSIYLLLFYALLQANSIGLKLLYSLSMGAMTGILFIVGHDSCHGSFTKNKLMNGLLGRLSFLPSFHSFSLWELGHNKTHHAFTNHKDKDYVYTPLSPQEYKALSPFKQFMYRVYRHPLGHGFYYSHNIWLPKIIFPFKNIPHIEKENKTILWLDFLLLVSFLALLVGVSVYFADGTLSSIAINIFTIILLPVWTWNWIIGFLILQHHTNEHTRWYNKDEEWHFWEVQMEDTVHIKFPGPLNFIMHNIMEHTAHHSNMQIPLYNLRQAQTDMEQNFAGRVNIVEWTPKFYLDSMRACKLYDYENHKWLKFSDI
ncbi:MAG: fatty acid desaturase [Saprospiraceae bacterium]